MAKDDRDVSGMGVGSTFIIRRERQPDKTKTGMKEDLSRESCRRNGTERNARCTPTVCTFANSLRSRRTEAHNYEVHRLIIDSEAGAAGSSRALLFSVVPETAVDRFASVQACFLSFYPSLSLPSLSHYHDP